MHKWSVGVKFEGQFAGYYSKASALKSLENVRGRCQIGIHSKYVQFDSKICGSIDSKGQKRFEKFDVDYFEIRSIRFDSTST